MEIVAGELKNNGTAPVAKGGSELMLLRLYNDTPKPLLSKFHIVNSRIESPLRNDLYRLFVAHDLPGDPASEFLYNGGWKQFHKLIFVSNWQMQGYCSYYNIPYGQCIVMPNAIDPIIPVKNIDGPIRIGYWSTPHRGLNILVPVFEFLSTLYPEIELDVFSSFKLYGWEQRDQQFEELFNKCRQHPKINYHGTVDNQTIRQYAVNADIFAYPSIWQETSCICLMEAMSAGMICVHSNLAALYETSANWTSMYQYNEDLNEHAKVFHLHLEKAIDDVIKWRQSNSNQVPPRLASQQGYADLFYDWSIRGKQWKELLEQVAEMPNTNTILLSK